MTKLKEEFESKNYWGISTSIDAYKCNPEKIRSKEYISQFAIELCDLIHMKRHGICHVEHFGQDERIAGISFTQLIETSLLSGHFRNQTNTAYIDLFSCSYYDPNLVADFIKKFFEAEETKGSVLLRE